MTPEAFCQWLQGHVELSEAEVPTKKQWALIKKHLQTVFVKVTDKPDKELEDFIKRMPRGSGPTRYC